MKPSAKKICAPGISLVLLATLLTAPAAQAGTTDPSATAADTAGTVPAETISTEDVPSRSGEQLISVPQDLFDQSERLGNTEAGGLAPSTCTTGFVVIRSGTRLLATAGHRSNTQRLVTSNVALRYVTGAYRNSYDAQVHAAPGVTLRNRVYTGTGNTNYSTITDRRSRRATPVGNYVCKHGKNTGYGRSYVASKTVRSSRVPSGNATMIGTRQHITSGGDSGGPWLNGNTAMGTHHGQVGSMSVYTSVSHLGGATGASIATR